MNSPNGWAVITDPSELRWWNIGGGVRLQLRAGPAGFLLAHVATWFHTRVEPLTGGGDDFGWSLRKIGGTDVWSCHASATAIDLNAAKHPQGRRGTFTAHQLELIQARLNAYQDTIKWGGNFNTTPDEMHWEIQADFADVHAVAVRLRGTTIGAHVIKANSDT